MLLLAWTVGMIFGAIFVAAIEVHVFSKIVDRALNAASGDSVLGAIARPLPDELEAGFDRDITAPRAAGAARTACVDPESTTPLPTPQPSGDRPKAAILARPPCTICYKIRRFLRNPLK